MQPLELCASDGMLRAFFRGGRMDIYSPVSEISDSKIEVHSLSSVTSEGRLDR